MEKYKITYETHWHKEDGSYDKKLDQRERIVLENYKYRCRPWWKDQNRIEEYSIDQISNHLRGGYFAGVFAVKLREPLAQYLLSEGEDIDGRYHYEKLINIEKLNN